MQIANIDDRVVMSNELLVVRDSPGRLHAEQFNHISLQVPDENFALLVEVVVSARVLFISAGSTLLGDWVRRNERIVCLW